MKRMTATITACILTASASFAAGVDKAVIPDSARWVIHVDVAAFTRAAVPKGLMGLINAEDSPLPAGKADKAREIWRKLGDVQSVTLYGPSHVRTEAVAVAKLKYDRAEVKKLLGIAPGGPTERLAGHDVHTFTAKRRRGDDGGQRYLCFYDGSTLVASASLDRLKEAVEILAGQGKKLARGNVISNMLTPRAGSVAVLAARGVDKLAEAAKGRKARDGRQRPHRAALLKKVKTLRMELGEADNDVFLAIEAAMKTTEDAVNAEKALHGLLGMMLLSQGEDELAAKVLQSARIQRRGSAVSASIRCPAKDILSKARAMLERRAARHAEKQRVE